MTIWLLALLLLASLAGLGYRQGAIRVGVSFFGIIVGALIAVPSGRIVKPIMAALGVKDPVLLWVLPPLVIFIVISILFKAGAAALHQKVDVYYKYRAGDLRLALWERLNHRLGLCLGLLNATAYLVLISFVVYSFSYWTFQLSSDENDPKLVRLFNRMGSDLHATGFAKVGRSLERMPQRFYETADLAGLLYNNSLLEARVSSYPAFLALAERSEFQSLGTDREFIEMRQRREPIRNMLNHPPVQAIMNNPELQRTVWDTLNANLQDFRTYLESGRSPKYDPETILGRWSFNLTAAANAVRRARPNIPATEMQKIRRWLAGAFEKTGVVAMTDNRIKITNMPQLKAPAAGAAPPPPQTLEGKWQSLEPNKYRLEFSDGSNSGVTATIEGDRLMMRIDGTELAFTKQT